MAKGCSHEIMGAFETYPLYHGQLKLNIRWSGAFKCNVNTYGGGLWTGCYIAITLFMWVLLHKKSEFDILKCHGLPIWCKIHRFEVGLMQNPVDHEILCISCQSMHDFLIIKSLGTKALEL
jgi:hypothetical protein